MGKSAPTAAETGQRHGARVVFGYPNFLCHSSARVLSVLGAEMQAVAVGWQVFTLTRRPLDLGMVGLAQFLPGILLFLLAGHTADRVPRRRILLVCYAAFACCSLALTTLSLHGLRAVWPIYAVLLANGVVRAFNTPTSQAIVPQLVPEADFPNAISWGSSVFQAAMGLGPVAGGLIYGFTGSPVPVYLGAAAAYLTGLV